MSVRVLRDRGVWVSEDTSEGITDGGSSEVGSREQRTPVSVLPTQGRSGDSTG